MIDLSQLPMGSLFSGVGGLELGLEWAKCGRVVWQVEADAWCRAVLAMRWAKAKRYNDVRSFRGRDAERVGIICGGFPCQDLSVAGKGAGLAGERSGLWFDYLRIVEEASPLVVVIENVAILASRGLDVVARGLVGAGYRVEARIISAADVGAPHRRERLFVVAIADGERFDSWRVELARLAESDRAVADAACARREGTEVGGSNGEASGRAARSGEVLADRGDDRFAQLGAGNDDDGRDAFGEEPDRCDPRMADADSERLRIEQQRIAGGRSRSVRDSGEAELVDDGAQRERDPESRLGRSADGAADRVDRWPARPGHPPAVWEPARSVKAYSPVRARRLHAIGNACVPQCLRPVADRIRERIVAALESRTT